MPAVVYRSQVENFRCLLSDVSQRKPLQMQIFIELLWDDTWLKNGKSRRQRKIWITALEFDEFCNWKFDKRRIPFNTGFEERPRYAFIILRSWMVTIILDFSTTQGKSQIDLFLFCWFCRGTQVRSRVSSSGFSFMASTCSKVLISITLNIM